MKKFFKTIGTGMVAGAVWLMGHPEVLETLITLAQKAAAKETKKADG